MPITASAGSVKFAAKSDKLADVIRRRFFYRQAFEIYGGVGGFFTYGPPGAAVKQNLIALWRKHFIIEESMLEVDDTCIMPYDVLFTSGHVERFNDFIVKDVENPNIFFRADKLLEDVMDKKMAEKGVTEEQISEFTKVKNQADAYSKEELHGVFQKYDIRSPDTKNKLSEPKEFNLMFGTPIGPAGNLQGYLRPETAQGIFLNFKFCLEQNSDRMPFGVAQVGKAFRNEIAPRNGLIRQREFTQAEIEFFCKPGAKAHPKFVNVASLELQLFGSPQQLDAKPAIVMTLGEAVAQGKIANETLGYFIGRTYLFLLRAGCLAQHIRFRQHLPDEMAHYASDCWDAEIEMAMGWVECVGIADRSAYDLNCHSKATKTSLTATAALAEPITIEKYVLSKKGAAGIGKEFKKDGAKVKEFLEGLPSEELQALDAAAQETGAVSVSIGGQDFSIKKELLVCEKKSVKTSVEEYTPHVIEPSFGIDRILSAVYEHSFYIREGKAEDKSVPSVLGFPAEVAPYKLVILPLDMRVATNAAYAAMLEKTRAALTEYGLQYKVDESGASLGKRYARNDELGIPYALTIDFDTLGMGEQNKGDAAAASKLLGTATLRDRDSCLQVRLPVEDLPEIVSKLCSASALCWADLVAAYGDDAAKDAAPAAQDASADMLSYLSAHGISRKLNDAVNELAKAKPEDPMAFLAALLTKA